VTSGAVAGS